MSKIYKLFYILWSLKNADNRKDFLKVLYEYFSDITLPPQSLLLLPDLTEPTTISWQATDASYQEIQNLAITHKVLLVTHDLSRTGAPYAVLYLARALFAINGIAPVIVSPKDGEIRQDFILEGFPVIVAPLLFSYRKSSPEICSFVASFDKVIVTSLAAANFMANFRGIARHLTWWIHETEAAFTIAEKINSYLPLLFAGTEAIWLGSPLCLPHVLKYSPATKTALVLYGCDDISIPDRSHQSEKMLFTLVGSVEQRKGQDIFLKAIQQIPKQLKGQALFRIIGSPLPSEASIRFYEKIRAQAAEMPEVECIESVPMTKLKEFYAQTHVLISASKEDPMPIVVTQGLMFSKVCLCSSAIGHAQLLEDGQNGLIFTSESVDDLAEKISWLLQNPTQLRSIGAMGRKIYEKHFLMSNFTNHVRNLLSM